MIEGMRRGVKVFADFHFSEFKSFQESTLLIEPLTLIIGANASGKSNALEGIQVLSRLAKPLKIEDILNGVRGQLSGIRGGSKEVAFRGLDCFEVGCSFIYKGEKYLYEFSTKIHPWCNDLLS